MAASSTIACPVCGKDDQVQKVTAAVSEGSGTLPQRLAKPQMANRPRFEGSHGPYSPDMFSLGCAGQLVLLPGLLAIVFAIEFLSGHGLVAPYRTLTEQAANAVLIALAACTAIVAAIVIAVVIERRIKTRRYQAALLEHRDVEAKRRAGVEAQRSQWDSEAALVSKAQKTWEDALYYCHRDDVVYLQGTVNAVPPKDMGKLLGIPSSFKYVQR
jgi:hypothetical protein